MHRPGAGRPCGMTSGCDIGPGVAQDRAAWNPRRVRGVLLAHFPAPALARWRIVCRGVPSPRQSRHGRIGEELGNGDTWQADFSENPGVSTARRSTIALPWPSRRAWTCVGGPSCGGTASRSGVRCGAAPWAICGDDRKESRPWSAAATFLPQHRDFLSLAQSLQELRGELRESVLKVHRRDRQETALVDQAELGQTGSRPPKSTLARSLEPEHRILIQIRAESIDVSDPFGHGRPPLADLF